MIFVKFLLANIHFNLMWACTDVYITYLCILVHWSMLWSNILSVLLVHICGFWMSQSDRISDSPYDDILVFPWKVQFLLYMSWIYRYFLVHPFNQSMFIQHISQMGSLVCLPSCNDQNELWLKFKVFQVFLPSSHRQWQCKDPVIIRCFFSHQPFNTETSFYLCTKKIT